MHGNPLDLTPNFDRMAREGTHLKNCFTPQPVCGPARSVMQTGQYATTTGCFKNGISLPRESRTLAHHFNEALGRLLDSLRSLGILDDTIVLFTSDHGCHFKTRNSEYKRSCHESSVHVPGAVIGPGFIGGGEVSKLVSLIDVPPTLLDSVGLDKPAGMQGRSFKPLLNQDPVVDWPEDVFIQISEAQVGRALRTCRWKYGIDAKDKKGAVDSCSEGYEEQYLYDLECDPYELTNLIARESHREVAAQLRQRLIERMVEAGEIKPEIVPSVNIK